ncbi:MAG: putative secondary metabolism biosynthetic enzyme [Bathelium mastoideum]|nr:MAG: putative secondary metabolism biosynthetic enzyme [Bathelium mastoideum]
MSQIMCFESAGRAPLSEFSSIFIHMARPNSTWSSRTPGGSPVGRYRNLKPLQSDLPEWLDAEVLPFTEKEEAIDFHKLGAPALSSPVEIPAIGEDDVAYLFHTSGTSSGLPKPIPQTHHAAVGVLPRLAKSESKIPPATFSTTPLYHGGIADLFRSWSGGATIYLFPAYQAPITAPNINRSLDQIKRTNTSKEVPPVKYFSSVPYVLQMLADDQEGLRNLQEMELVGVGGAALPPALGDSLVKNDVNLVSRYGSVECGFLLSSHRNYALDKDWQYLRTPSGTQFLEFEAQHDAEKTYELVVQSGWPHMSMTNREDGSYATSDLFVKHQELEGAWKYHSRKDAQLTLITGKKFDPAPLEAAIVAGSPLIAEAVIFGNDEPYPGALLFRSKEAEKIQDDEFLVGAWKVVDKINEDSQQHAKLVRAMLVPMPSYASQGLEKSSKGTLLRKQAEQKFQHFIRQAYSGDDEDVAFVSDGDVKNKILEITQSCVQGGEQLTAETNLFSFGLDSAASLQIRSSLRKLLPKGSGPLPLTIVEDCGNVQELSNFIERSRHGETHSSKEDNEHALMHELIDRYSTFSSRPSSTTGRHELNGAVDQKHTVVLTGATGALGSHVLTQLRDSPNIAKIYCLVRGATSHAAHERISKALSQRGLAPLQTSSSNANPEGDKVIVLPSRLNAPELGLSTADYEGLATSATLILHLAWSVNFRLRLANFTKDSIASVTQLLRLALSGPETNDPPAFIFCSSLASASSYRLATTSSSDAPIIVPEEVILDPHAAAPMGYARSKWVAEQICHRAAQTTPLHGRLAVLRVGQLAGDTEHGVWNEKEAWPLMLRSVRDTHTLPALRKEALGWLGVNVAAKAVVEMTLGVGKKKGRTDAVLREGDPEGTTVYHILNEHLEPTWMDLLEWLKKTEDFEILEPKDWVNRLENLRGENPEHPILGLLGLWRDTYGDEGIGEDEKGGVEAENERGEVRRFATEKSKKAAPTLKTVKPVDEEYFGKMWQWIKTNM